MIYVPKHFKAFELVDPQTFAKFGEQSFQFFRREALEMLDQISDLFPGKAITVNNWKSDGSFHWRGLRTIDCTQGAAWSAHRLGAAFDFNVAGMQPRVVYDIILATKPSKVRRMEDIASTPGWCHIDCIDGAWDGILIVKP